MNKAIHSVGLAVTVFCLCVGLPAHAQVVSGDPAGSAVVTNPAGPNLRTLPKRLKDYGMPGLDVRVNLKSINDWKVIELIEFLAYQGGLNNIVISKGVSGLVTKLKFDNVSVGDALEVVLSVNRLAYDIQGGIITIMTDEEFKAMNGVSFYDQKQVRTVTLQYADAARVATILASIKSDIGTVVSDPVTGTLILIDTADKIAEMTGVIEKADISTVSRVMPTVTKAFVLQHAEIASAEPKVASMLTPDVGKLIADERSKTLIITDLPHNMQKIVDVISLLDRRPKQVFIEAKILLVALSDQFQLGINWQHVFEGIDPRFRLGSTVRSPVLGPLNPGVGSIDYKAILGDGSAVSAVMDALKTVGDTKLLSNPHVAVMDGQEATIAVVQDTPYAETSVEITGGDTNFVGETIRFIEVGVSLKVKPRVSDSGMISMALRPEISTASYDYQAFRQIPVVKKTYTETSVMIKDGETIIIAGMIENDNSDTEWRVPWLGRIPLLGYLFKSVQKEANTRETVVFLTPRIITGEEPVMRMQDMKKMPKPMRSAAVEDAGRSLKAVR